MLAPRDTATRQRKSLDGLWRFSLDPAGIGRGEGWPDGLPAGAREMPVPSSYNDVLPEAEVHDHVGEAWYETLVRVPASWAGERIVLRFGSATHRAVVWVNGTQVAEHEGGYTPFEADVTDVVAVGAENRDHGRRGQPAELAVDPSGLRRGHAGRAPADATSTTSSTTRGCTGPSGSTRRPSRT